MDSSETKLTLVPVVNSTLLQAVLTLLSLLAACVQLNYSGPMLFERSAMIPVFSGAIRLWMASFTEEVYLGSDIRLGLTDLKGPG